MPPAETESQHAMPKVSQPSQMRCYGVLFTLFFKIKERRKEGGGERRKEERRKEETRWREPLSVYLDQPLGALLLFEGKSNSLCI